MDEPIRVAMVMGKMVGGGVESVVMNYYRFIDRNLIQFDFIIDNDSTNVPSKEIELLGGKIFKVPPYQKTAEYLSSLEKIFKDNKFQIVHSHINALSIFPLYMAKKCGIPIRIAHSHSTASKGEYKKNLLKNILRPFSKIYPTHFMAPTLHAGKWLFGDKVSKDKLIILNNAIDTDRFEFDNGVRMTMKKKMGYNDSDFLIGTVGRLVWQKNHEFLLKVFKKVNQYIPQAKLVIVGDGPLEVELKELARQLSVDNSVQFIENSDNVEDIYQVLDYFIFPSNYEGLGIVAIESQIMGLPTICSQNVPEEVKLTNLCKFLDLSLGTEEWADYIADSIKNMNRGERTSRKIEIQANNYDIRYEAKKLAELYIELGGQNK